MHKLLTGLNQNGEWPGVGEKRTPTTDVAPPAQRDNLPPAGHAGERVKTRSPPSPYTTGAGQRVRKKRLRGGGPGMREQANAGRNGPDRSCAGPTSHITPKRRPANDEAVVGTDIAG